MRLCIPDQNGVALNKAGHRIDIYKSNVQSLKSWKAASVV